MSVTASERGRGKGEDGAWRLSPASGWRRGEGRGGAAHLSLHTRRLPHRGGEQERR